jgi:hypothetical protein
MKKHMKNSKGVYAIKGSVFKLLIGSRAQVWHGTAYKTAGGLIKKNLKMNKNGRIVSAKKHATAKKEKRLEKFGFFAKKGSFGSIKKDAKKSKKSKKVKKTKKSKTAKRRR